MLLSIINATAPPRRPDRRRVPRLSARLLGERHRSAVDRGDDQCFELGGAGAHMPTLDRQDNVFVLDLGDGENRFHPDWIASVDAAVDEVEKAEGPRALVTAATGKFYSNGLDLEWLSAHADQRLGYVISVHELFARMLSLPMITVAALQGHTFAAGAMFSLAHDFRVMRLRDAEKRAAAESRSFCDSVDADADAR
jgi:hypothetical protein